MASTSVLSSAVGILVAVLGFAPPVRAQRTIDAVLRDFPVKTLSIEYDNLSALRALPNFAELQRQYLGQPLQDLETAFASAGISSENVDDIAIGSQTSSAPAPDTYGVFSGRFIIDAKSLGKTQIGQTPVYCLSKEKSGLCFAKSDGTIGVFGSLENLRSLLGVQQGIAPAVGSNRIFTSLLNSTQSSDPLRGVSDGAQIGNYVKEIVPDQAKGLMDWSKLFSSVRAFSYSIRLDKKAHLTLQLECQSEASAADLRQLLAVMGSLQSAAGQGSQVQNVQVQSSGTRVTLKLDSELTGG